MSFKKLMLNKKQSKKYEFLEVSWTLMIGTFLGVLIINILLYNKFHIHLKHFGNSIFKFFFPIFILLTPILISRFISFTTTKIILTEKGIEVIRHSLVKSNFSLSYAHIDSYIFQNDLNWYWFKVQTLDGKVYRIWKFGWFKTTEFLKFKEQFIVMINSFNQKTKLFKESKQKERQIKIAKSVYQGTSGLILGIVSFIILIGIPILLIKYETSLLKMLFLIFFGISGALFTLRKVLSER